jgi:hypothetical protein
MIPKKHGLGLLLLLVLGCTSRPLAPTAKIYNENADAHREIAAAITKATVSNKNIVLIFGANW